MPCPYDRVISTPSAEFGEHHRSRVREQTGDPTVVVFQRGFHENVITSRAEHIAVREYIVSNPGRWNETHPI